MSKLAIKGNDSGSATFTIEAPATSTDRTLTLPDEAGTVLTSASDISSVTGAGVPDAIDVDASAPADSVAIDSSGNVGIGTSSPARKLEIKSSTSNINYARLQETTTNTPTDGGSMLELCGTRSNGAVGFYGGIFGGRKNQASDNEGYLAFYADSSDGTALAERMRINSAGAIIWGNSTSTVQTSEFSNYGNASLDVRRYADAGNCMLFRDDTTISGTISVSGSSCSYNTSSDYRLKENVVDMTGAITRVKSLSPKRFNWIADTDDTTIDGFIAHEAATVVPEAVTGTHDAVEVWQEGEELPEGVSVGDNKLDENGNTIPVYQGIDQSKLVPLLTGALQEAIAKIETLETTVADLQTRVTALESV